MSDHSPLPWKGVAYRGKLETIVDAKGDDVVQTDSGVYINTVGDLEFIIEAVNTYARQREIIEELQEALSLGISTLKDIEHLSSGNEPTSVKVQLLEEILARSRVATGESQ